MFDSLYLIKEVNFVQQCKTLSVKSEGKYQKMLHVDEQLQI